VRGKSPAVEKYERKAIMVESLDPISAWIHVLHTRGEACAWSAGSGGERQCSRASPQPDERQCRRVNITAAKWASPQPNERRCSRMSVGAAE